jgi:hypothetical protein
MDPNWLKGAEAPVFADYLALLAAPDKKTFSLTGLDRKLFVAMTSRTGGKVLSEALIPFGLLVDEYFSVGNVRRLRDQRGLRNYGELCAYHAAENAPHGAFGARGNVQMMAPLFLAGEFPDAIPHWKFVYLTRRNLVRQAISLVIAEKSGAWTSRTPAKRAVVDADYSAAEIARQMRGISRLQARLEVFFAIHDIKPLRLTFEDLIADIPGTASKVANHCKLVPQPDFASKKGKAKPLEPQSSELNIEWERRFRGDAMGFVLSSSPKAISDAAPPLLRPSTATATEARGRQQ